MSRTVAAIAASALIVGTANGQQAFLPAGGSVSYNGGGLDWTAGTQTLDSVGATAPVHIGGNNCNNTGAQQSPIDIVYGAKASTPVTNNAALDATLPSALTYTYPPLNGTAGDYKVEMNEHTMEVKFNLANNWNTTAYGFSSPANGFLPATQLHFHSPSEHTINGQHFPFELHIVNQVVTSVNTTAKTASAGVPASVIAIMFKYTPDNTPNPWLQPILDATPTTLSFFQAVTNVSLAANQYASKINAVESTNPGGRLDLSQIVSQADPTKYFTYPGTLTTPACNQVVTFYVLTNPLPISYAQVIQFTNLLARAQGGISRGADNRPPNAILSSTTVKMNQNLYNALYPAPAPAPTPSPATTPSPSTPAPCVPTGPAVALSAAAAAVPRALFVMAAAAVSAVAALAF